jgi:hypothetical protein
MLVSQPSCDAQACSTQAFPHARLPRPQSVAAATTEMMWAVALATMRASILSTAHGLAVWSRMLNAPIAPWFSIASSLARQSGCSLDASLISASSGAPATPAQEAPVGAASTDAHRDEVAAFASYRSSGGHAAAQVISHH